MSKKKLIFALTPGLVVGVIGISAVVLPWQDWVYSRPEPVAVTFDHLDPALGAIRVEGTAHFRALVKQHVPATLWDDAKTVYCYGLFPLGDTENREIRLLVRTDQAPDGLVDFENMRIEGLISKPDRYTVPFQMEQVLGDQSGYYFSNDLSVLSAWSHETIGAE